MRKLESVIGYWLFVLVLVIAFAGLLRPLFHAGFPYTHDGENHLARIANYAMALKQGQLPPRWAPSFLAGYGYPVFNFNYPLPDILALPLLAAGLSVETALKIMLFAALVFGASCAYAFLRCFVGKYSSLFGTFIYLSAPFLFVNLYVRGAVGEVLAYAVFPWFLLAVERLMRESHFRYAVQVFLATVFLSLAHNIFALLLLPLGFLYLAIRIFMTFSIWKTRIVLVFPFLLGVLATAFFWVPALAEKSLITLDNVNVNVAYALHFPTLRELIFSPYQFGFSYPAPVDTMPFSLGGLIWLSLFLVCILPFTKKQRNVVVPLALCVALTVFFMLSVSAPVWTYVPLLRYIQFPWRLLFLTSLFGSMLAAYLFEYAPKHIRIVFIFVALVTSFSVWKKPVSVYIHNSDLYYKTFAQTSTIQDENRPKTFVFQPQYLSPQAPVIEKGEVIRTDIWNGSHRKYVVQLPAEEVVIEPTAFFPGWETTVDGKHVDQRTNLAGGRIAFMVPAGQHTIETRFTENTPSRVFGDILAVVAVVGFFALSRRLWEQNV